jgi:hypothetical protein
LNGRQAKDLSFQARLGPRFGFAIGFKSTQQTPILAWRESYRRASRKFCHQLTTMWTPIAKAFGVVLLPFGCTRYCISGCSRPNVMPDVQVSNARPSSLQRSTCHGTPGCCQQAECGKEHGTRYRVFDRFGQNR